MKESIKLFEDQKVRSLWDAEQEKWYISIVDVVGVLIKSPDPRNYWKVLKHRLIAEGNESVTNCNQLKMQSADGKYYKTDVADVEQLFRKSNKKNNMTLRNHTIWLSLLVPAGRHIFHPVRDESLGRNSTHHPQFLHSVGMQPVQYRSHPYGMRGGGVRARFLPSDSSLTG